MTYATPLLRNIEFTIELVKIRQYGQEAWNEIATRLGCSIRSSYQHLRGVELRYPTRILEVYFVKTQDVQCSVSEPKIIGLFVMLRGVRESIFYDGVRLDPDFESLWTEIMTLALQRLGRGAYAYGWMWGGEPAREEQFRRVAGVRIRSACRYLLWVIDFSAFPNWDAYYRRISENSRRNYVKAVKTGQLVYERAGSWEALPSLLGLLKLRQSLSVRKALPLGVARSAVGFMTKLIFFPAESVFVRVRQGGRTCAAMRLAEFGPFTYYFDGANSGGSDGSGWLLIITALKKAFERAPQGRFLLGFHVEGTKPDLGLDRSREALRPTTEVTSIVEFEWGL